VPILCRGRHATALPHAALLITHAHTPPFTKGRAEGAADVWKRVQLALGLFSCLSIGRIGALAKSTGALS